MKKILKYIFNTLLFVSSLALVSCSNILQDEEQKSSNKITLTANIDFGDSSRKITPMDYSLYSSLKYELVATCNTNNDYSTKGNFTSSTIEMELIAANWSFELTAYDAANTPILRSSENKNIDVTKDTVLNFKMVGLANGTLIYDFKFSSRYETLNFDDNPIIIFDIYKYSGSIEDSITENNHFSFSNLEYTNEISKEEGYDNYWNYERKFTFSLSEGTYIVICRKAERPNTGEEDSFELPDPDPSTVTSSFFFQELVEIKAGLTTISEYNNVDSASPEYKITLHTNGGEFESADYLNHISDSIYSFSVEKNKIKYTAAFPTPTKQNCVFAGWYYDSTFTHPVTYDFAYRFDLPDTEDNNVSFWGNCDLYAKWEMVNFTEIMMYASYGGNSSLKPVVSSDWSSSLEGNNVVIDGDARSFTYKHAINVGNDVYGVYYESSDRYYSVFKNSEIIISKIKFNNEDSGKEPKKIAYDSVTKKIVVLLASNQSGIYEYSFMTCNQDGSGLTEIDYSEESKNALTEENFSSQKKPIAFAVHNNKVYFSLYQFNANNPEEQFSKLYVSDIISSEASLIKIQNISDFIGSSMSGLEEFIQVAQISDIYTDNDVIYASVRVSSDGIVENNLVHFGLIVKVNPTTYMATPLFKYNSANTKILTSNNYDDLTYYGINGLGDKSCLAGPTRILAIKEDELVFVDEGVYMWISEKDQGYFKDVNRIVVFDLERNSIKYLCEVSKAAFEYTPGTLPEGFNSISNQIVGKDSW